MNFEGLETVRAAAVQATFDSLVSIIKDEKQDIDARLKAAKILDGMSDSIIAAFLTSEARQDDTSTKKQLMKGLDKLHGHNHGEE